MKKFLFLSVISLLFASRLFAQTEQCGFYIRSSFDSECISTIYERYKPNIEHEEHECLLACVGSMVKYSAVGNISGLDLEWQVAGAESYTVHQNGAYINVTWSETVTEGQVILTGTDNQGNVCTETLCVQLIERPEASFVSNLPFINDNGVIELSVCNGQEIQFINTSTGSADAPIVGYYWDDGVNTYSTENITLTADFNVYGEEFKVRLEVQNECGCKDVFYARVYISKSPTLKVDCYGTACEGNQATYTVIDADCSDYFWSVEGGSILSGADSSTVTVAWNDIADGYGYIGLDGTHCGNNACPNLTYLPIPVVADEVPIEGPTVVCKGEYYSFKLPIWASTSYQWFVQGGGVNVNYSSGHPHEFLVEFTTTGTKTIHCNYENDFLGCSGTAIPLTIQVKEPVSLISESQVCEGESVDFTTDYTGNSPIHWKLYNHNMSLIAQSNTPNYSYTFNTAGSYTITANCNDFCSELSRSLVVNPAPVIDVNEVSQSAQDWVTEVCPNGGYLFSLPSVDDAYFVHWESTNGQPNSYDGLDYNVEFSGSISDIKLYYVDKMTGCKSEPYTHTLTEFTPAQVQWNIPSVVCVNSEFTVTVPSEPNVLYEWSVANPLVASISSGVFTNTATVQTNAISQDFVLKLKRIYCDTDQEISVNVNMEGNVTPDFNLPTEICQYESLTLTPSVSNSLSDSWTWIIGNANPVNGYTFNGQISEEGVVPITLKYTNPCGDVYSVVKNIYVNPAPEMIISSVANLNQTITFLASTQDDAIGPFTYQWKKGSQIIGTSNPIAVAIPTQLPVVYTCLVTNQTTGCVFSEEIEVKESCGCNPGTGDIIANTDCGTGVYTRINFTGNLQWTVSNESSLISKQTSGANNEVLTVVYQYPGIYTIKSKPVSNPNPNTCPNTKMIIDTIPLIPQMQVDYTCWGNNKVKLHLINSSAILPEGVVMDQPIWKINGSPVSSTVYKPNGTYQIELTIGYSYMGEHYTCSTEETFVVNRQNANFSISPSPYCEKTPVSFTNNTPGAISYLWTFVTMQQQPIANLSPNPTISFAFPGSYMAQLKVSDAMGCSSITSKYITINGNAIKGLIDKGNDEHCAGELWELLYKVEPYNVSAQNSITQYQWSSLEWGAINNNQSTYNATQTGTYQVNVQDNKGCKAQSPFKNICFKNTPIADILGNDAYCENENISFTGYSGDYTYQWTLNGQVYNTPNLNLNTGVLSDGNYTVNLQVSNGDCSASDHFDFVVHPSPSVPNITLGNSRCIHQPPVDLVSNSGQVYWNTGDFSSSTQTYTAGYHSAYRIDPSTGCRSNYKYLLVEKAPDFSELMTGCYEFCPEDLSKWILGPFGVVDHYKWLLNNNMEQDGTFLIPNLQIPDFGSYHLGVEYGNNCFVESEDLIINEAKNCDCDLSVYIKDAPKCFVKKCQLMFDVKMIVENTSNTEGVYIESVTLGNGTIYNISGPLYIAPNHTTVLNVIVGLDDYTPAIADFVLNVEQGKEPCVFNWNLDLSPYMDRCIDNCGEIKPPHIKWEDHLSDTYTSYYYLIFNLEPNMEDVQIMPQQGQVYFEEYHSNSGEFIVLFAISNIELQNLLQAEEKVCFDVYACLKDYICKYYTCIKPVELIEAIQLLDQQKHKSKELVEENTNSKWNASGFYVYPNPANATLNIESQGVELQSYAISNLAGQICLKGTEDKIDIQSLSKGTYLIKIVDAKDNVSYLKFVKS